MLTWKPLLLKKTFLHIAGKIFTTILQFLKKEPINHRSFINQFRLDAIQSMRQPKRIYTKMGRQKMSVLFNEIYIYVKIHLELVIYNFILNLKIIQFPQSEFTNA